MSFPRDMYNKVTGMCCITCVKKHVSILLHPILLKASISEHPELALNTSKTYCADPGLYLPQPGKLKKEIDVMLRFCVESRVNIVERCLFHSLNSISFQFHSPISISFAALPTTESYRCHGQMSNPQDFEHDFSTTGHYGLTN